MSQAGAEFVIQADGLTRYFGDFLAVDRVTFDIHPGEVVGYLDRTAQARRLLSACCWACCAHRKALLRCWGTIS